jgi:ferredoxin-NADP reductase
LEKHETRLVTRQICDDIATMSFERPQGWEYRPGRWLTLTLETPEGEMTRTLSHASAPSDSTIDIGTRLSGSAFKVALRDLELGGRALLGGPGGRLALPSGATRIAFLTGGIGITPVRSFLRDAASRQAPFDDALLLYGNRSPECVPYLDELEALEGIGLRLVPVYESAPESWTGERGFITAEMVRHHLPDVSATVFMVSGPPVMVEAMASVLDTLGVPAGARVVESFGPPRG